MQGEDEETDLLSEFGGHLSRQELILRKRDSEAQMEKLRISVANEYESESKQRHVTLYTPFWFINDSFLQLMLKSKGASKTHSETCKCIVKFSFYLCVHVRRLPRSKVYVAIIRANAHVSASQIGALFAYNQGIVVSSYKCFGSRCQKQHFNHCSKRGNFTHAAFLLSFPLFKCGCKRKS